MDTPRTPRDNLRTSPGLEDLEADELEAPLLPSESGSPAATMPPAPLPSAEVKRLLGIGAPLVAEELLSYGSTLVALAMAGRLGGAALSAFSLSHAVTNITGITLLNGLTGAVDTFSSQAHGSRTFPAVGVALQRALALGGGACVPLMALYWDVGPLLRALGQATPLAAAAARYTRIFSPKILLHALVLGCYRTLAAQGAAGYVLAAGALFFAVTAPLNWLFIWGLGWGLDGSAAAAVACEAVYAAALVALCVLHNARQPPGERWWHGWDAAALRHGWGPFLRLSLAATLMVVLDWWAYDILTLLAGLLPDPGVSTAATGIAYNVQTIVFTLPLGLSSAACTRVGHHLGAARPRAAKLAAELSAAMGVVVAGVPALLLLASRGTAAAVFTRDADVIQACHKLTGPLATVMITNGAAALLTGILRGSGRQQLGVWTNGAANYMVGLPASCVLAFHLGAGLAGLWWGMAAAAVLQATVLAILVSRFDWGREVRRADKLVRHLSQASMASAARRQQRQQPMSPGSSALPTPAVPVPPLF